MSSLERIRRFAIPRPVILQTEEFLRIAGQYGHEGLALWCGAIEDERAVIKTVLIPAQQPVQSEDGICVVVGADALHDVNVFLYQNHLRLIAQVHSHGEHAYHSDTDNRFSIVTTLGALSIVVPFFASDGIVLANCAIFRLHNSGWYELEKAEKQALEVI